MGSGRERERYARVAPPDLDGVQPNRAVLRVLEDEEDEHRADGDARVERGGQDVVVLRPPREMTATDDVLEDESDDRPGHVVDGAGGGDGARSGEDDGEAKEGMLVR